MPRNLDARHAELAAKYVAETITQDELDEAQALVDKAAKAAGYDVEAYHATRSNKRFTVFRKGDIGFHFGTEYQALDRPKIKQLGRYKLRGNFVGLDDQQSYWGDAQEVADALVKWDYFSEEQMQPWLSEDGTIASLKQFLSENGIDGFVYENVVEDVGSFDPSYVVIDPSNIKSAEPFTFDNDYNLIPLSERFRADSPDIRHNPEPSERTYYEIGHRGLKSKLWYGDEFNINVEPAEFDTDAKDVDPRNLHNEWALRMPWHGRYDPYSGEVSIMGGTMTEEWRQPSEQMLDRLRETFGADVKIVQFNPLEKESDECRPIRLWRAADDDYISDSASFSEKRAAAEAYLSNRGFGGPFGDEPEMMESNPHYDRERYSEPYSLLEPERAEQIALDLQEEDPDWSYQVRHDPKGTGLSFIEIFDEEGKFVGRWK